MSKNRSLLLIAALAISSAGCYQRTESGQDGVYSAQWWVPVAVAAVSVALGAFGLFRISRGERFRGISIVVVAFILLGVGVPMPILDRVVIGPDKLYLNTGFWFAPTRHDVRLSDVARAAVEVEVRQTRHGPENNYILALELKSGQKDRIPVGDLMKQAFPEILERLNQLHVPVAIPPDADLQ
jgi:hypothetical protein